MLRGRRWLRLWLWLRLWFTDRTLRPLARTGPGSARLLVHGRIRSIRRADAAAETRHELIQFAKLVVQVGFETRPFNTIVRVLLDQPVSRIHRACEVCQ